MWFLITKTVTVEEEVKSDWLSGSSCWINPANPDTSITRPLPRPFYKEKTLIFLQIFPQTFKWEYDTKQFLDFWMWAHLSCKLGAMNYVHSSSPEVEFFKLKTPKKKTSWNTSSFQTILVLQIWPLESFCYKESRRRLLRVWIVLR